MIGAAQKKAVRTHRQRLRQSGRGRFEVQGRLADKAWLRQLAKALAQDGAAAIKAAFTRALADAGSIKWGVLSVLLRSPLIGIGAKFERL